MYGHLVAGQTGGVVVVVDDPDLDRTRDVSGNRMSVGRGTDADCSFVGCPNWELMEQRLLKAMAELGQPLPWLSFCLCCADRRAYRGGRAASRTRKAETTAASLWPAPGTTTSSACGAARASCRTSSTGMVASS